MHRILLLTILSLFLETCQMNKSSKMDIKFNEEFYSALNELVKIKLPNANLIVSETMPIYKSMQGNYTSLDTIDHIPPPPPPPGEIFYDKNTFDYLIYSDKLDSTEGEFMYDSIDSSKIVMIDSSKIFLRVIPNSKFKEILKKHRGNLREFYNIIEEIYGSSCFIKVSTPIFNSNYSKVIISIDYSCGPLAGGGQDYILEKKNGKWMLINESGRWVS